ncbi:MAG TPA: STAS domain-containing protein [Steroidobacteraceae bacterium]|jgi:rsbT co-antagonist protein RsbR|nr:STAS domain-containing protein [Steroidobacteraceae bacterium]
MAAEESLIALLERQRGKILAQWLGELASRTGGSAKARIAADLLARQANEFFSEFMHALATGSHADIGGDEWKAVRTFLEQLSTERVLAGFSSEETAIFIFSLKRGLFDAVSSDKGRSATKVAQDLWSITELLDKLGLHTVRAFQRSREEVIDRQQTEMLELSTPVVKLWDGILALPLIGTLDSARTQIVMESLLQRIVETESQIAIIDITGVPTVDTLVAQHLLKAVTALRLMGAECIVSGVRPQIAQTIVHLGVDLQGITTKANLADALALALKRTGVKLGN